MAQTPPIVLEPRPVPGNRNWAGWICLFMLIGFLFIDQLGSYFRRDAKSPEAAYTVYVEQFKTMLKVKELRAMLPGNELNESTEHEMDLPLERLKARSAEDPQAARLYVSVLYEEYGHVPSKDLGLLRSKEDNASKAFVKIYGSDSLTPGDLDKIRSELDLTLFMHRVALSHAESKAGLKPKPLFSRDQVLSFVAAGVGLVALFFVGIVAIVVLALFSSRARFRGNPLAAITPAQADLLAIRGAGALLGWLLFNALLSRYIRSNDVNAAMPGLVAASLGAIVSALVFYWRPIFGFASTGLREIGLRSDGLLRSAGWGLLGAIANVPIIAVLAVASGVIFQGLPVPEHPIETQIFSHPTPLLIAAIFLMACIEAPFFEEILFRGKILPGLASLTKSPILAGIVSSLLFAVIHPTGIPAWPMLAAVGGMSAFLTYRTGSLTPSIFLHAFHNCGTLILALMLGS